VRLPSRWSRLGLAVGWLSLALLVGGARPPSLPGPALRRAVEAYRAGRTDEAAAGFAAVARLHPLVADYATSLRVRALVEGGRPDDAIAVAYGFERDHPDSPLRAGIFRTLGDAYRSVDDEASARESWRLALEAEPSGAERAALRFALAESLERSGDLAAAASIHRDLWRRHPTAPSDAASVAALERLGPLLGSKLLAPADWVARGEALYAARDNEAALAAYDRALADGIAGKRRRAVERQRGFTLFRLRRYPEASAVFDALPDDPETRFWRARCYARRGEIARSIAAFEQLGRGRSSFALRSRFLAGTLLDGEGDAARAEAHFRAVADRSRSARRRQAAGWRLGWTAYRTGRFAQAEDHFARLAADVRDPIDRLRSRYWRARTQKELGKAEYEQELTALALEYPFTYYGVQATAALGDRLPERLPEPREASDPEVSFDELELLRLRVLLEADLSDEAVSEIRRLSRRSRGLGDRLEIARLYAEAGDFHGSQRTVLDVNLERLARGPAPGREELWWYAWPWAFPAPLERATAADGVEPALVLAVMREESGYRPAVVSPVGARGLLQIMPATGGRLAADLGSPTFDPAELFRPETNIRFGTHYLGQLLGEFDGNHAAAIASYNAGPNAVSRWLRENAGLESDEWIEAIPYNQTRSYVKRVLRSLHAYRVLY